LPRRLGVGGGPIRPGLIRPHGGTRASSYLHAGLRYALGITYTSKTISAVPHVINSVHNINLRVFNHFVIPPTGRDIENWIGPTAFPVGAVQRLCVPNSVTLARLPSTHRVRVPHLKNAIFKPDARTRNHNALPLGYDIGREYGIAPVLLPVDSIRRGSVANVDAFFCCHYPCTTFAT